MLSSVILASGSLQRLGLLEQIGIKPRYVFAVDVDETSRAGELPRVLASRLAKLKSVVAREKLEQEKLGYDYFLLTADTVVAVGRRVLPKAQNEVQAKECLRLLSGRSHNVVTAVCVVSPSGEVRDRIVVTRVKFKRLCAREIADYLSCGEWRGKAGGYAIQGMADMFVCQIVGSYSNVVGLPLHASTNLLYGLGYK